MIHGFRVLGAWATLPVVLACSIELTGSADPDSGAAGSGGSTLGGFGGGGASDDAGAGAGGVAGSPSSCASGFQCVPTASVQWAYAFLALDVFANAAGPTCPDGADPQTYASLPSGAGGCAPCQCAPLQGGACTVPLLCAENATCANAQSYTRTDGDCAGKTGSPTLSCMLGPPTVVTPGTCAASGGSVTQMDPFEKRASLCLVKEGPACGATSTCVPVGTGVYAPSVCVYLPGEQTCPGDWPTSTVIYQKHVDQRVCSPCTCSPGSVTCLAEYQFYDDMLCAGSGKKVASTACTNVSGAINDFWAGWGYKRSGAPVQGGGCVPGGGLPSGGIVGDPNAAITVCCRQAQ